MAWDSVLKGISRAYGPGNKIPIQRYSDKKRSSGSPPLSDSFQLQCTGRLRPISIYLSIHLSLFGPNSLWVLLSACICSGKRIVRQTQRTERRIGMNSLSGQICCYHSGVCLSPSTTCSSQIHRPSIVVVINPPGSANESLILGSARE